MWLWFEGQGKEMRRIFAPPQPPSGIAKNAAGNEGWEEVGASCEAQDLPGFQINWTEWKIILQIR